MQTFMSTCNFRISDHHGYPAFFTPCRNEHYTPVRLTAFLIKILVRVAETNLDQWIVQIHVSIRPPLLGTDAFRKAAAKADVQLPHYLPHATYMATLKWLIGSNRYEDSPSLILAIDIRSDGCDHALVGVRDQQLREKEMFSNSLDFAFVERQ